MPAIKDMVRIGFLCPRQDHAKIICFDGESSKRVAPPIYQKHVVCVMLIRRFAVTSFPKIKPST